MMWDDDDDWPEHLAGPEYHFWAIEAGLSFGSPYMVRLEFRGDSVTDGHGEEDPDA